MAGKAAWQQGVGVGAGEVPEQAKSRMPPTRTSTERPMGKPGWPRLEEESGPVSSRQRGRAATVPRESPGLKLAAGGS